MSIGCVLCGIASLAAAVALLLACRRRLSRLGEELGEARAEAERAVSEAERALAAARVVWRSLSSALSSVEAEDALERLRRRRRRRYIAFYIVTEDGEPPSPDELEKAIVRAVERLGGQLAVASARPQLAYYHPEKMAGILRTSHEHKYVILAALGLVRRVGGKRALIIPVRTTGTIKRAKRALGLPLREVKA